MNYKVFVQNKTVEILTQRINFFLSTTNVGDSSFKLERYNISTKYLLTKLLGSSNVDFSNKQLFILSEFTLIYRVLNKTTCANFLPLKNSFFDSSPTCKHIILHWKKNCIQFRFNGS